MMSEHTSSPGCGYPEVVSRSESCYSPPPRSEPISNRNGKCQGSIQIPSLCEYFEVAYFHRPTQRAAPTKPCGVPEDFRRCGKRHARTRSCPGVTATTTRQFRVVPFPWNLAVSLSDDFDAGVCAAR